MALYRSHVLCVNIIPVCAPSADHVREQERNSLGGASAINSACRNIDSRILHSSCQGCDGRSALDGKPERLQRHAGRGDRGDAVDSCGYERKVQGDESFGA